MRADILMRVRSAARITASGMLRQRPVADVPISPPTIASPGDINPDALSPKDALELICELKKLAAD